MKYKKWVCFAGLFVIAVIAGKSLIRRYEEACKEWQQKCVEVELVAVKDSKYFGDVIPISRNRGR